jgi:hypothetical protein
MEILTESGAGSCPTARNSSSMQDLFCRACYLHSQSSFSSTDRLEGGKV